MAPPGRSSGCGPVCAVPEAFQQQPGRGLLLVRAGDAGNLGWAGADAVTEQLEVFGGAVGGDGVQALVAGQVRLVDEGAQGVRGLAGPDRIRVGLGGVLEIPEDVGGAELVLYAAGLVVVLVPVVHDDRAVQVAVDEGLEGRQVPVAGEVIGEHAGARDVQVFLLRPGAGAGRSGVSPLQMTRARMISARIAVFAAAARSSSACTHPSPGRVPVTGSRMSAQRSTGTWCITSRNTHQAWKFSP